MSTTLKTAQEILASKNKRGIKDIPQTVRSGIRMTKTQLRFCMIVCFVLVIALIIVSLIAGNQAVNAVQVNEAAELLSDAGKITDLQYGMILEFTEQVGKLRRNGFASRLTLDVADYVRRHLSEPVSVDGMAEALYLSRPYLSARFRKETGQTLTDYILNEKTEEAKCLLRYSDKSAASIAAFLGFSSHGHFCRVFRKYAGMTPNEYRSR